MFDSDKKSRKVAKIVGETVVNQNVYNGSRKMVTEPVMFMTGIKISECISDLKLKNTEGFDRIPQRILIDGHGALIEPLTQLFQMIYRDQAIPGQWLSSKFTVRNYCCQSNYYAIDKDNFFLTKIY